MLKIAISDTTSSTTDVWGFDAELLLLFKHLLSLTVS